MLIPTDERGRLNSRDDNSRVQRTAKWLSKECGKIAVLRFSFGLHHRPTQSRPYDREEFPPDSDSGNRKAKNNKVKDKIYIPSLKLSWRSADGRHQPARWCSRAVLTACNNRTSPKYGSSKKVANRNLRSAMTAPRKEPRRRSRESSNTESSSNGTVNRIVTATGSSPHGTPLRAFGDDGLRK